MKSLPTIERVKALLDYDPLTGRFTWKIARGCAPAGAEAGFDADRGYRGIRIDGTQLYLHRVAWFYQTGVWPNVVDHLNGERSDNRFVNLRDGSQADNLRNAGMPPRNTSGVVGVCWDKSRGKWTARIKVDQRVINLGRFESMADAIAARLAAERAHGFSETHGKRPAYSTGAA